MTLEDLAELFGMQEEEPRRPGGEAYITLPMVFRVFETTKCKRCGMNYVVGEEHVCDIKLLENVA